MADRTCPGCNGARVTTQTKHEIVTKPDGTQTSEARQITGPCGRCGGRGTVTG